MGVTGQDATGAKVVMSTTTNPLDGNNLVGSTCVTDPITGAKQTVSQLHNADQQLVPAGANSSFSTGTAQLQDPVSGLVNRQRETGQDNASPLGIASGAANLAMQFKVTCNQNLSGGVSTLTLSAVSGVIGSVPWAIRQGTKLVIDSGAVQETLSVQSVNTSTKVVTFTAATLNAHNGSTTPFPVIGMVYNQGRDASGENDGATGSGTAIAAEYEFNGGDPSGGNFDRGRSLNAKGLVTQTISAGGGAGSVSLALAANTGLQPGMKVMLYKAASFPAAGFFESVNVDLAYTPGSNTVPLASAIVNSVGYDTIAYDAFAALGPQLNGFLPFGVGIEAQALYDAISGKMFTGRMASGAPGSASVFSGGNSSALNVNGATVVKASAGRVVRVSVITLGTTAGSVNDVATTGAAATANQILAIPANQVAGTVYYIDWPCSVGIVVTPGTSGVLAVAFA